MLEDLRKLSEAKAKLATLQSKLDEVTQRVSTLGYLAHLAELNAIELEISQCEEEIARITELLDNPTYGSW